MKVRTCFLLASTVLAALAAPSSAGPAVGVDESAFATVPLVVGGEPAYLQLLATRPLASTSEGQHVRLEVTTDAAQVFTFVPVPPGAFTMTGGRASLSMVVAGLKVRALWRPVEGSYTAGGGTTGFAIGDDEMVPSGTQGWTTAGTSSTTDVVLGERSCPADFASTGHAAVLDTETSSGRAAPKDLVAALAGLRCGTSTATSIPPKG